MNSSAVSRKGLLAGAGRLAVTRLAGAFGQRVEPPFVPAVVVIDGFVSGEDEMGNIGEDGGAARRDAS